MKISEEFPSQYIKASDLGGREIRATMQHVEREKIGTDLKLVLYFKNGQKGLVLNKTNANTIGDAYGDDTDDWSDQPVILFSVKTDYQGKVVDAIRCRVPTAKDNKAAQPTQRREDPISSGPINPPQRQIGGISDNMERLNDDVPF